MDARNSVDVPEQNADPASESERLLSRSAQAPEDGAGFSEVERLENLVETLSYTLHGLSHDLREPIRTVRCYSELLGTKEAIQKDPNLVEYIYLLKGAAERMDALVSGIAEYSRSLERNQQQPFALIDMNDVVQMAIANLQLKIDESSATVVYDPLPQVWGDCVQLAELFQNIIGNGLNYRGEAPPQILIRAEDVAGESLFSIEDNGVGIDPKYHQSIFVPFKRLHGQEVPGTGLGLAICRQIVEHHGGKIWVESVLGEGSTFHFTIPGAVEAARTRHGAQRNPASSER